MKKLWRFVVSAFLLLFLTVGCQSANSSENKDDSNVTAEASENTENQLADVETGEAEDGSEEVAQEETDEEEPVDDEATDQETDDEKQDQLQTFEEKTVDGITVKIVNVEEFVSDAIESSRGQFVSIEMELKNDQDASVEISSLRNFSLLVGDQPQDLAYIEGISELSTDVPAGDTVTKQIVFDCSVADEYQFSFQLSEEEPVSWTFSLDKGDE
ncbi:hypothetical protein [Fervidibacillus albus]|uniref:DUF4352 domain-containing protein n=1 Tax=Fervidibacillus albus TaxID=2980026 RepID=A0A9E8RX84_9BACI|nr:hypothetical protein [Fervidibacillus albus]WAA10893.1 hypothetical protein OE104_06150 [Fervidibacillus albus]